MLKTSALAQIPGIDSDAYLISTREWLQKLFCTKLKCWSYEYEWRIGNAPFDQEKIADKVLGYMKVGVSISSIILGERMRESDKKLIKDIVTWTFRNAVKLQIARVGRDKIIVEDMAGNS